MLENLFTGMTYVFIGLVALGGLLIFLGATR